MISNASAQEFRRNCHETLGFLSAHGFSDARLSGDPPVHSITVTFYGKALAIECIWDDKRKLSKSRWLGFAMVSRQVRGGCQRAAGS